MAARPAPTGDNFHARQAQIAYALDDVHHVLDIWDRQRKSLTTLKRLHWVESEFQRMLDEVAAERGPMAWTRLPGLHRLSPRELAVVRALYQWRNQEGSTRNRPVRRILRDDLIIELARRRPTTEHDLLACRDLNRPEYKRVAPELLAVMQEAVSRLRRNGRPHCPPLMTTNRTMNRSSGNCSAWRWPTAVRN